MAYLIICFFFALAGGIVGRSKGSSFFLWFAISGLIPVLGLVAAVFYRNDREELRRECPNCGRLVKLHDQVCMRCGEDMYFPARAVESESAAMMRR